MSELARELLYQFRGEAYAYGDGALVQVGQFATELTWRGYRRAVLVCGRSEDSQQVAAVVKTQLAEAELEFDLVGELAGAARGAPYEDVQRLAEELEELHPNIIIVVGGSSGIDAVKAANVLATYGGALDDYAGEGKVTRAAFEMGKTLIPTIAVQMAAGAAAHLSRYVCVGNRRNGGRAPERYPYNTIIVDGACVPSRAIFQYDVTMGAGRALTISGAFIGLRRHLEALLNSASNPAREIIEQIAPEGIRLIVEGLQWWRNGACPDLVRACPDLVRACPDLVRACTLEEHAARTMLSYGTDLGGYAATLGGHDKRRIIVIQKKILNREAQTQRVSETLWVLDPKSLSEKL